MKAKTAQAFIWLVLMVAFAENLPTFEEEPYR